MRNYSKTIIRYPLIPYNGKQGLPALTFQFAGSCRVQEAWSGLYLFLVFGHFPPSVQCLNVWSFCLNRGSADKSLLFPPKMW